MKWQLARQYLETADPGVVRVDTPLFNWLFPIQLVTYALLHGGRRAQTQSKRMTPGADAPFVVPSPLEIDELEQLLLDFGVLAGAAA